MHAIPPRESTRATSQADGSVRELAAHTFATRPADDAVIFVPRLPGHVLSQANIEANMRDVGTNPMTAKAGEAAGGSVGVMPVRGHRAWLMRESAVLILSFAALRSWLGYAT